MLTLLRGIIDSGNEKCNVNDMSFIILNVILSILSRQPNQSLVGTPFAREFVLNGIGQQLNTAAACSEHFFLNLNWILRLRNPPVAFHHPRLSEFKSFPPLVLFAIAVSPRNFSTFPMRDCSLLLSRVCLR
jgi:hypothetical protein